MNRSIHKNIERSILRGALFFLLAICSFSLAAQDSLSVRTPREMPAYASDTARNRSLLHLGEYDSLRILLPTDSLLAEVDSSLIRKQLRREYRRTKPLSPDRAMILSAILPGLGQAYVGKAWKIPVIYGAGIGIYYYFNKYNNLYNYFRTLYLIENAAGIETTNSENNRDLNAQYRNYLIIGFGALYLLNIADAMTDAYFRQYDISDDLSLRIKPTISRSPMLVNNTPGPPALHYGISFSFALK